MAKDKTKYECAHCGERFIKMLDHMSHVIEVHDTGFRKREDRLQRPISCWYCGIVDVYPRKSDGLFVCEVCGWELPKNWVNGQLTAEDGEPIGEIVSDALRSA